MLNEDVYKLSTYNYILPKELIAQSPVEKRDESCLLCYKRDTGCITHKKFYELCDLLSKEDVLVLNNTKVIPAKFRAVTCDLRPESPELRGKSKEIEILLVSSVSPDSLTWKVLAKPKKHLSKTQTIILRKDPSLVLRMTPIEVINSETIRFKSREDLEFVLKNVGEMPLPPYIKRDRDAKMQRCKEKLNDFERYQTVFAKEPGAVAAPTAALHFTNELLEKLQKKGVEVLYITLHVGPGTFLPIRTDDIREHKLIPESYYIDKTTWDKIQNAKKVKKRIIACGTTTVRALEYAERVNKLSGLTSLYIVPGFEFKIVDALITNFHLPKTTLLVLISAFTRWENVKRIYEEAIKEKYRFYSYGDAMFIE